MRRVDCCRIASAHAAAPEAVTGVAIPAKIRPDSPAWQSQATRNTLQLSLPSSPCSGTSQRTLLFNQFGVGYEPGARTAGIGFADPRVHQHRELRAALCPIPRRPAGVGKRHLTAERSIVCKTQ